ncbi:MAG: rRNA maturation RNase YbeY [Clostridiales bacterium]|nr:rRNA maturation RNase YbeY [Clostridiales bacterium]
MEIVFNDKRMPGQTVVEKMHEAAEVCLAERGLNHNNIEISVSFMAKEEISSLNKYYRGVEKPTDVLSFPQYSCFEDIPKTGKVLLGDVVICTDQALLQADEFGHSPERELVYLLVHSIFHLLGHGHEGSEEKEKMRELEEKVMKIVKLER